MRLPLAPTNPPAKDTVSNTSAFSIIRLLGGHRGTAAQSAATETTVEGKWTDPSLLLENMVGAFAARMDNLMADMSYASDAPGFFSPVWMVTTYEAGLANEQWMTAWSHMRRAR